MSIQQDESTLYEANDMKRSIGDPEDSVIVDLGGGWLHCSPGLSLGLPAGTDLQSRRLQQATVCCIQLYCLTCCKGECRFEAADVY